MVGLNTFYYISILTFYYIKFLIIYSTLIEKQGDKVRVQLYGIYPSARNLEFLNLVIKSRFTHRNALGGYHEVKVRLLTKCLSSNYLNIHVMEIRNENKVFFGESGITSTSATYLCNIARELLKDIESSLNNISFITEEVTLFGSENKIRTKEGYNLSELSDLDSKLTKAAQLKAFIAWMSEGIKAKDVESEKLREYTLSDFIKDFPEYVVQRSKDSTLDPNYGLGKLDVSERVKYLFSEALTSSIGKYIHNNGALRKAYSELLNIAHNKVNITTEAKDSIVVVTNKIPSVDTKEVEKIMLKYQDLRRENEKVLNSLKSKIKSYDHEYQMYLTLEDKAASESYNEKMEVVRSKYNEYVLNKRSEIEKLKIIIPDGLRSIYNDLHTISKEK